MKIVTGAITADEAMRSARLLGPDTEVAGSMPVTNSGPGFRGGGCGGLDGKSAEPAFAAAVLLDRAFQRRAIEVRPVHRREHELRIGRLPEQEVGEPLLARGADDEVGIGKIRRVEPAADEFRRDGFRLERAIR